MTSSPKIPVSTETPRSESAAGGPCDAAAKVLMVKITSQEIEVNRLDMVAKNSPKKENFRNFFDAEVTFADAIAVGLKSLADCPTSSEAQAGLKKKAAKARANLSYLSESFPDFK